MTHEAFDDPELATAITLIHCDGTRTVTRGQVTYAPKNRVPAGGDMAAAISKLTVHAQTPENTSTVAQVEVPPGTLRRVIAADRFVSGIPGWNVTRPAIRRCPRSRGYQGHESSVPAGDTTPDVD